MAPQNYFLLAPTRIFLGIGDTRIFLLGDSSLLSPVGVYYASPFVGTTYFPIGILICFSFLGELHPFPDPLQWVGTPTSRWGDVWCPCPPSAVPTGGETPRGPSPTGVSGPMSWTQTGSPLVSLPHRTSPSFSCPLPPFPISSSDFLVSPAPSGGSVPPPANRCQWTTEFVPSTATKRPPSAVYHTMRRPDPSAPPSS